MVLSGIEASAASMRWLGPGSDRLDDGPARAADASTMAGLSTVGIVGAGAWGMALAQTAARGRRRVLLFARDPAVVRSIRADRLNPRHLPEVALESSIEATADLARLDAADLLLLTVPAQTLRSVARALPQSSAALVICAKGLEAATGQRLSQVLAGERPESRIAVLSGPNFAREVAQGLPAATTLGCADAALGQAVAQALSGPTFRVYWTDDVAGVEIGGAVKNVLAIAAGVVAGRGLGENARAALITRGLAELARLGEALGARRETLMGLAGLGDLILSASSLTSRNMAFGHAIGQGADPQMLRARPGPLVEGVFTAAAVTRVARERGVDVPICAAIDAILAGRLGICEALDTLMRRPLKMERG
jgi:glycerol-3-phosphate dehydrogenase (NAD(P)+)